MQRFFRMMANILRNICLAMVRIYQIAISPFFPQRCNFRPTCSEYTLEAIKIHGIIVGIYLGVKRILKCTPNREFTYDPVPKKKK